jgi:hypothetical protein
VGWCSDVVQPGESILYLPGYLKARVDDEACRAYTSACFAEINMPLCIGTDKSNINSFKAASKTLDELKHDFRIMYLKKQRAQSEVDMLSEAIARTVGEYKNPVSMFLILTLPSTHQKARLLQALRQSNYLYLTMIGLTVGTQPHPYLPLLRICETCYHCLRRYLSFLKFISFIYV